MLQCDIKLKSLQDEERDSSTNYEEMLDEKQRTAADLRNVMGELKKLKNKLESGEETLRMCRSELKTLKSNALDKTNAV